MASPTPKTTILRTLLGYAMLTKTFVTETALQANMCCDQTAAKMISIEVLSLQGRLSALQATIISLIIPLIR